MQHTVFQTKLVRTLTLLGVVLLAVGLKASFFAVDITEYVVVTRFGQVMRVIDEPGLRFKLPTPIESVVRLPKRLLSFKPPRAEYLTQDKKNIVVQSLVTWKIAEPEAFLERVVTGTQAEARLIDIVFAEIGTVLGTYPFAAIIAPRGQETQYQTILSDIRGRVSRAALSHYGIEVVDVWLRQLMFPEQNRASVFARMKAERGRIAMRHRSEGGREFKKLIAAGERKKGYILAEAYKEAERLKGAGDAEAMRIYAKAFRANPPFYKFLRTLEAYEKFLDANTTVFFPADAEALQLLDPDPQPQPQPQLRE